MREKGGCFIYLNACWCLRIFFFKGVLLLVQYISISDESLSPLLFFIIIIIRYDSCMFWRNVFEYAERMELSFMGRTFCFLWDVICYRKFKATMWYYWSGWLWKVTKVDVHRLFCHLGRHEVKWSVLKKYSLEKKKKGKKTRWDGGVFTVLAR